MKQLLVLFLAISLFSCDQDKDNNSYKLEGEAIGFADGSEILVYSFENKQPQVIDTIIINQEKFSASYPKEEGPNLKFLRIEKLNGSILFFPENENMKATLYKDSIYASRVKGGKQNESYSNFASKMAGFNKKKQAAMQEYQDAAQAQDMDAITRIQSDNINLMAKETEFKKEFLKDNNNSLFGVMLVGEMLGMKEISATEASEYLKDLNPKLAESDIAKELITSIEGLKKADIGVIAPDFSAPTPTGEMLSLNDALGKYTIIDFWASWCKPCRVENPNVVNVYKKYHDKGLNIISVSLDKEEQKDKWLQAIKDDQMDWHHVSNLKFWNDPIAAMYSVRSIPATFLLDADGKIIDKNLRGPALEAKIASLLGE